MPARTHTFHGASLDSRVDIDIGRWPDLKAYVDRVAACPKVKEAMKADGLVQ